MTAETSTPKEPRRLRGMGSIYRRGRIWWLKYRAFGRVMRETSGSPRRSVAVSQLKARLAAISAGRFAPDADKVTAGDLFNMLMADQAAKGNRSHPAIGRLCEAFEVTVTERDGKETFTGGWKASALTTDRVRAYEAERLAAGAARATVNNELAALRRAFNLAVEAGRLAARPIIKTPDPHNARRGFVTERQAEAVRDALPERLRGAWEFCYLTGWRVRSEVLPLTWANVDWRRGVVRIEDSKNGEPREFPFADYPALKAVLTAAKADTNGPCIFHDAGKPISYQVWNAARRKACKAVGVEAIAHDLRRTAVRNLERAGVSRSVAMSLTGHKTEAVFRRYAIVDSTAQREGVAKLARATVGHTLGTIDGEDRP